MLRDACLKSVTVLAEKLTESNMVVSPIAGTPLQILCSRAQPLVTGAPVETMDTDNAIAYTKVASMFQDQLGKHPHDDDMASVVETVAKTIQTNLHMARNIVNPLIKEVVAEVEAEVKAANVGLFNLINVVPNEYHDIWDSVVLRGMVDVYQQTTPSQEKLQFIFPMATVEQVGEWLKTGVDRFDKELGDWITNLPKGFALETYSKFYTPAGGLDPNVGGDFEMFFCRHDSGVTRDDALVIYLIARNLKDNIPDGMGNISLSDYQSYMANVLAQSGRKVYNAMIDIERENQHGRMVQSWGANNPEEIFQKEAQILVNPEVYTAWLEKGGSPEILFGAFLTDQNTDPESLLAGADAYKTAWTRQFNLIKTRANTQLFNVTLQALRRSVAGKIVSLNEDQVMVSNRGALHQILNQEIAKVTARDLEDIYCVARRLVCTTMFMHTQVEEILSAIDDVSHQNPGMDIREAALLATIDVVVIWVCKLIELKKDTLNI